MIGLIVLIALYLWWSLESLIDIRSTRKYNKEYRLRWIEKGYNDCTLVWIWFTSLAIFALCVSDLYKYFNK